MPASACGVWLWARPLLSGAPRILQAEEAGRGRRAEQLRVRRRKTGAQGKCGGGRGLSPVSTVPGRWSPASASCSCWWHKPQGCHPGEDVAVTSPKPSVSWRCWEGPPPHWAHSTLPASCASSFQRLWKSGCLRDWGGRLPHWKIPEDRGSTRQPVHIPSALPSWVDSAGRFALPGLFVPHHSLRKP